MSQNTILVVDDERDIVKLITYHLEKDGFRVITAFNGEDSLYLVKNEKPALIILDLMLPGIDGLEVCKKLKADQELDAIPIIMLTAKGEENDITQGLGLGADDYVTKPFSPKELVARVHSVLRRIGVSSTPKEYIKIEDLVIDKHKHTVTVKDEIIPVTLAEFRLLYQLAVKPGRVFTRDQLLDIVSGVDSVVVDRTIDVHIAALRKKLKGFAHHIITIRGIGYKFRE